MGDDTGDVRWMSHIDLGAARGISPASARRLAIRKKRHQPGNDRLSLVAVPALCMGETAGLNIAEIKLANEFALREAAGLDRTWSGRIVGHSRVKRRR